jgi:hypothetical protein
LRHLNLSERLIIDAIAVYAEIKTQLRGMSVVNKVKMILSHMGIGYQAVSNAYERMTVLLQSGSPAEARKLIDNNKKPKNRLSDGKS